jgi:putative transposase
MSKKTFRVSLSDTAHQQLQAYVTTGRHSARSINRARILLLANEGKSDPVIAEQVGVCKTTVFHTRRRYCAHGVSAAVSEQPRSGAPKTFTGRDEAKLTTLACTDPPEGYHRWTMRLLADRLVRLEAVEAISPSTVCRLLKKTTSNRGKSVSGACDKSRVGF